MSFICALRMRNAAIQIRSAKGQLFNKDEWALSVLLLISLWCRCVYLTAHSATVTPFSSPVGPMHMVAATGCGRQHAQYKQPLKKVWITFKNSYL